MRLTQLQIAFTYRFYVPCKHAFYRVWSDMLGQGGTLSSLTSHKDEEGREGSGLRPLAQGEAGRRGSSDHVAKFKQLRGMLRRPDA